MDRGLSPAIEHGGLQRFHEQPLAAQLRQGTVQHFITACRQRLNGTGDLIRPLIQSAGNLMGLGHRQLRCPAGQPDGIFFGNWRGFNHAFLYQGGHALVKGNRRADAIGIPAPSCRYRCRQEKE